MGLNPFMMDAIIYLLFAKPSLAESFYKSSARPAALAFFIH